MHGVKLSLNRSSQHIFDQMEFPTAGPQSPQLHPLLQVTKQQRHHGAFLKSLWFIAHCMCIGVFELSSSGSED